MDHKSALRREISHLSEQATTLQNELHDTVEGLPRGWEKIVGLAVQTAAAFERLQGLRRQLKELD